ncbi:phage head-tail joining protein [Comamonas terrigena]|uniref:phage head-tail joining protein n=1 Tax=Comamonas terrigena TaxID=32013 RepID=UPI0028AC6C94|nr:hypothetical protein [Comamonas terrigena]
MALTQADLDALDLAIASGELTVSFSGRTTTYQTTKDLLLARQHVARVLAAQAGGARSPTFGGRPFSLANFNHHE